MIFGKVLRGIHMDIQFISMNYNTLKLLLNKNLPNKSLPKYYTQHSFTHVKLTKINTKKIVNNTIRVYTLNRDNLIY